MVDSREFPDPRLYGLWKSTALALKISKPLLSLEFGNNVLPQDWIQAILPRFEISHRRPGDFKYLFQVRDRFSVKACHVSLNSNPVLLCRFRRTNYTLVFVEEFGILRRNVELFQEFSPQGIQIRLAILELSARQEVVINAVALDEQEAVMRDQNP